MTERLSQAKQRRLNAEQASQLSIQLLRDGHQVRIPAGGFSMFPYLRKADLLQVEPVSPESLEPGDIIVFQRKKQLIAHRLSGIERSGSKDDFKAITIGDACVEYDEPVHAGNYLGKVTSCTRRGRIYYFDAVSDRLYRKILMIAMPLSNRLFYTYRRLAARIPKMLRNRLGRNRGGRTPAQNQS
jgi:signal peptidase I